MKKLLAIGVFITQALLLSAQVDASVTFDFQNLTDTSNGAIYGKLADGTAFGSAINPLNPGESAFNYFKWTKEGITLRASAKYFGSDANTDNTAWAYLDKGKAGLGVCHQGIKGANQCDPNSDDNVTTGEILKIAFNQKVSFNFNNAIFKDGSHNLLQKGLIKFKVGRGHWEKINLAKLTDHNYSGRRFSFGVIDSNQFYLNNMVVASVSLRTNSVPEPSSLAIFALGILGLASRRFKK